MPRLTLAQASTIVDAALAKGRELKLLPLTVVVLDAGGHMVALKREDGSGIARVEIATGKAWAGSAWVSARANCSIAGRRRRCSLWATPRRAAAG